MELIRTEVPDELGGDRADRITAVVADMGRSLARRLVEEGKALFDGERVAPHQRIGAGVVVEIEAPEQTPVLEPEHVPFAVAYEDEHLAVVDKPAGIVVHPGAGAKRGTLAAGILLRWPQVRGVGDEDRWGIVHRLDRGTSGLLVVALRMHVLEKLREMVARHEIERGYLALVHGAFEATTGKIDAPISRHPRRRGRMRVDAAGRPARTRYRVAASWTGPELSLIEVQLETGRTHQIRVHLASIGHPVVSDPTYGRRDGIAGRQFLHAASLALRHPVTGSRIEAESTLPDDLRSVLDALGGPATGRVDAF